MVREKFDKEKDQSIRFDDDIKIKLVDDVEELEIDEEHIRSSNATRKSAKSINKTLDNSNDQNMAF